MVDSSNTNTQEQPSAGLAFGARFSRHDLILAAIPLVFAIALTAALALSIPLLAAIGAGSIVSSLLLADALYLNPPAGHVHEDASTASPSVDSAQETAGTGPTVDPNGD